MDGTTIVTGDPISTIYRPTLMILSPVTTNISLIAGSSVNLTCDAINTNARQWVRQTPARTVLTNTSDGARLITPDYQLQFSDIQVEDTGEYRCLMRSDLERGTIFAFIDVGGNVINVYWSCFKFAYLVLLLLLERLGCGTLH